MRAADDDGIGGWGDHDTVLITGGTGALGAHVARSLAASGARHLVLTSRRGPGSPGAAELVAELEELGALVTVADCDVADRDQLARLLDSLPGLPSPASCTPPVSWTTVFSTPSPWTASKPSCAPRPSAPPTCTS